MSNDPQRALVGIPASVRPAENLAALGGSDSTTIASASFRSASADAQRNGNNNNITTINNASVFPQSTETVTFLAFVENAEIVAEREGILPFARVGAVTGDHHDEKHHENGDENDDDDVISSFRATAHTTSPLDDDDGKPKKTNTNFTAAANVTKNDKNNKNNNNNNNDRVVDDDDDDELDPATPLAAAAAPAAARQRLRFGRRFICGRVVIDWSPSAAAKAPGATRMVASPGGTFRPRATLGAPSVRQQHQLVAVRRQRAEGLRDDSSIERSARRSLSAMCRRESRQYIDSRDTGRIGRDSAGIRAQIHDGPEGSIAPNGTDRELGFADDDSLGDAAESSDGATTIDVLSPWRASGQPTHVPPRDIDAEFARLMGKLRSDDGSLQTATRRFYAFLITGGNHVKYAMHMTLRSSNGLDIDELEAEPSAPSGPLGHGLPVGEIALGRAVADRMRSWLRMNNGEHIDDVLAALKRAFVACSSPTSAEPLKRAVHEAFFHTALSPSPSPARAVDADSSNATGGSSVIVVSEGGGGGGVASVGTSLAVERAAAHAVLSSLSGCPTTDSNSESRLAARQDAHNDAASQQRGGSRDSTAQVDGNASAATSHNNNNSLTGTVIEVESQAQQQQQQPWRFAASLTDDASSPAAHQQQHYASASTHDSTPLAPTPVMDIVAVNNNNNDAAVMRASSTGSNESSMPLFAIMSAKYDDPTAMAEAMSQAAEIVLSRKQALAARKQERDAVEAAEAAESAMQLASYVARRKEERAIDAAATRRLFDAGQATKQAQREATRNLLADEIAAGKAAKKQQQQQQLIVDTQRRRQQQCFVGALHEMVALECVVVADPSRVARAASISSTATILVCALTSVFTAALDITTVGPRAVTAVAYVAVVLFRTLAAFVICGMQNIRRHGTDLVGGVVDGCASLAIRAATWPTSAENVDTADPATRSMFATLRGRWHAAAGAATERAVAWNASVPWPSITAHIILVGCISVATSLISAGLFDVPSASSGICNWLHPPVSALVDCEELACARPASESPMSVAMAAPTTTRPRPPAAPARHARDEFGSENSGSTDSGTGEGISDVGGTESTLLRDGQVARCNSVVTLCSDAVSLLIVMAVHAIVVSNWRRIITCLFCSLLAPVWRACVVLGRGSYKVSYVVYAALYFTIGVPLTLAQCLDTDSDYDGSGPRDDAPPRHVFRNRALIRAEHVWRGDPFHRGRRLLRNSCTRTLRVAHLLKLEPKRPQPLTAPATTTTTRTWRMLSLSTAWLIVSLALGSVCGSCFKYVAASFVTCPSALAFCTNVMSQQTLRVYVCTRVPEAVQVVIVLAYQYFGIFSIDIPWQPVCVVALATCAVTLCVRDMTARLQRRCTCDLTDDQREDLAAYVLWLQRPSRARSARALSWSDYLTAAARIVSDLRHNDTMLAHHRLVYTLFKTMGRTKQLAATRRILLLRGCVEHQPGPPKRTAPPPPSNADPLRADASDNDTVLRKSKDDHVAALLFIGRHMQSAQPGDQYVLVIDEFLSRGRVNRVSGTVHIGVRHEEHFFSIRHSGKPTIVPTFGAEFFANGQPTPLRQWAAFPENPHKERVQNGGEMITYAIVSIATIETAQRTADAAARAAARPTAAAVADGAAITDATTTNMEKDTTPHATARWICTSSPPDSPATDAERIAMARCPSTPEDEAAFTRIVKNVTQEYRAASTTRRSQLFHTLMSLPKRTLRTLAGSSDSTRRKAFAKNQLTAVLEDPSNVLVQNVIVTKPRRPENTVDARGNVLSQERISDNAKCRSCKVQARSGQLGRGARILMSDATAATSTMTLEQEERMYTALERLHPAGAAPDRFAHGFRTQFAAKIAAVTPVELHAAVSDGNNGASPGGTAWTAEMLLAVMKDANVNAELAVMFTDLVRNDVHNSVRRRLRDADLIGIPKPGGSGVRPITLCEEFLKIASRIAIKRDALKLKEEFGDIQLGVSTPRGAEIIVHRTRAFVRSMSGTAVVVCTDMSNAYNSPLRQTLADAVRPFLNLAAIFELEYAEESCLRVRGAAAGRPPIKSSRGSRQGGTASGALFCLALHPMLKRISTIPGVKVAGFCDDLTLMCADVTCARQAIEQLEREAADMGITLNKSKCMQLCANPNQHVAGIPVVRALKTLGAAVSFTDALEADLIDDMYGEKFTTFFRRLRLIHGPVGTAVLAAAGVPKLSYLLRVHPMSVIRDVVERFDAEVEHTWAVWAECEPSDSAVVLAHLPIKYGGCGFTRASLIANAAYVSSHDAAMGNARDAAVLSQKALTAELNAKTAANFDATSNANARHREHNCATGTAAFIRKCDMRVRPDAFAGALRFRLGTHVIGSPEHIVCGGCNAAFSKETFSQHASCTRIPGNNASARHAAIKVALKQVCFAAGISFDSQEPRHIRNVTCPECKSVVKESTFKEHLAASPACAASSAVLTARGSGPDILIYLTGQDTNGVAVDVTVVAAECQSHASKPLSEIFDAVTRDKRGKYEAAANAEGLEFVVFGISEGGMLSTASMTFLRRLLHNTPYSIHDATAHLQAAALLAHGATLVNAERKAGISVGRPEAVSEAIIGHQRLQADPNAARTTTVRFVMAAATAATSDNSAASAVPNLRRESAVQRNAVVVNAVPTARVDANADVAASTAQASTLNVFAGAFVPASQQQQQTQQQQPHQPPPQPDAAPTPARPQNNTAAAPATATPLPASFLSSDDENDDAIAARAELRLARALDASPNGTTINNSGSTPIGRGTNEFHLVGESLQQSLDRATMAMRQHGGIIGQAIATAISIVGDADGQCNAKYPRISREWMHRLFERGRDVVGIRHTDTAFFNPEHAATSARAFHHMLHALGILDGHGRITLGTDEMTATQALLKIATSTQTNNVNQSGPINAAATASSQQR